MAPQSPTPLILGRFRQLPQRMSEVWQGGLVRLPTWIENPVDPDDPPFRPVGAVWVSLRTGRMNLQLPDDGRTASTDLALACLLEFAAKESKQLGGRPSRIEVRDIALKDVLETTLAGTGTDIAVLDDLPAVTAVLHSFEQADRALPFAGLLAVPKMTVDRVRAFADAAARFYEARPWQHLTNDDLIVVAAPKAPTGMSCVCVLGDGGDQFGLGFFESRRAFERTLEMRDPRQTRRAFGVTFGPVDYMAIADADLWEDHALPVAGVDAYPIAADFRTDRVIRPSASQLTFAEALLRAFADTTEDELDAGQWQREVVTFDEPIVLSLSLPYLLEAESVDAKARHGAPRPAIMPRLAERASVQIARMMEQRTFASPDEVNRAGDEARQQSLFDASPEIQAGRPLTDLEHAQEIAYDAQEATGRARIKLAKKALSISADCADAYVVLGEAASTPDAALEWYRRGVDAGARVVGIERLTNERDLWEHLEARPYMRARLALARVLEETHRGNEAIEHCRDLLRMNRHDNQGVRYLLLPWLLLQQRDEEAGSLLAEHQDDMQALWPYARALWLFRMQNDSTAARAALQEATRINRHVVAYLLDPDSIPWLPSHFALGSREEAAYVADALIEVFEQTDGALEWIDIHARHRRGSRRKK